MRLRPTAENKRWPAFLPVVCVCMGLVGSGEASFARDIQANNGVYKIVLKEEARVIAALRSGSGASLRRSAHTLGSIVDRAVARKQKGIAASSCEFAAQSLANVAIFVEHGMRSGGDWQSLTLEASVATANDFARDMNKCERDVAARSRDHHDVAKVLKALYKNGKS